MVNLKGELMDEWVGILVPNYSDEAGYAIRNLELMFPHIAFWHTFEFWHRGRLVKHEVKAKSKEGEALTADMKVTMGLCGSIAISCYREAIEQQACEEYKEGPSDQRGLLP